LHHARNAARNCDQSAYISLAEQDRSLWDENAISRGRQLILTTLAQGQPGPYQIQAAISALHCEAQSWQATDWSQIAVLYDQLLKYQPTPVVELNKAIALGFTGRLTIADQMLCSLEQQLANYQPFYAARGFIFSQLSKLADAKIAYERAIALTNNRAEKSYLQAQISKLGLD
jgi:RNA polymerase sigma-70 factor (ECF subfamily)